MAFEQLEPFGYRAMWGGFAMLAALTYNINRPKGKKAAKPADFMPKDPVDQEDTVPDWKASLKRMQFFIGTGLKQDGKKGPDVNAR